MKKRMLLLVTVPCISMFFCVAIVSYAYIAEGWTSFSRTQLVTYLDQPNRRAATLGWTAYYAPIAPGGGLHFPIDAELTPQVNLDYGGSGRGRSINWSTDQHLESGWISSRIPAHFVVRRAHSERQRVEFRPDADGKWTATNGLNVNIDSLVFADPDGNLHRASGIEPGSRMRLEPDVVEARRTSSAPRNARAVFQGDWLETIRRRDLHPDAPGNYIATTTAAAFLDPGIEGTEIKPGPSLIFGVTEHARP